MATYQAKLDVAMQGVRDEIKKTLYFFIDMNMKMEGHITKGTLKAFAKQKVEFPKNLKHLIGKGEALTE